MHMEVRTLSGVVFLLAPCRSVLCSKLGLSHFYQELDITSSSLVFTRLFQLAIFVLLCLKIQLCENTHKINHPNHLKYADQYRYA